MRYSLMLSLSFLLFATAATAADEQREQIRVVGSSTVFPFISAAAEQFAQGTGNKTPIVESTGTGGGIKLFCAGTQDSTPDMANASRRITPGEIESCAKAGVKDITEVKLGYDGIVLADTKHRPPLALTRDQLFLALARRVPQESKLVENPYTRWNEIDPTLPDQEIEVYGPPPTSGTRDAFVEMVMEKACESFAEYKELKNKDARKAACTHLREDGKFIEAGENDNIIAQKLKANEKAYGIFGFSFLDQNRDSLQAAEVNGVAPTPATISDGSYPVSRMLYVYVKLAHVPTVKGMQEFVQEIVSDEASGDGGYLTEKGLIPLHAKERSAAVKSASALEPMKP